MSMLDAFFNKGFKGAQCKTLLKLTIPRIKLLRNRREIQLKQMRRDIAKLLESGQEATARIRVEHIIREENMMAAQEIIELFCELIAVRLPIIETQRECPLDLKEAISSICFAAPRCSDLPELQQVQMLFAAKYGKEFVAAATELRPECGVNRQVIELLSIRAPPVETKLKLLKEIAEEHEIDWDPAASETEFLKPHEDLLNGSSHHLSGSTLPLPKEKHDELIPPTPVEDSHELPVDDADAGFDSLDLPEVPKVSLRPSPDNVSAPETVPPLPSSPPPDLGFDHEITKSTSSNENDSHKPCLEPGVVTPEQSAHSQYSLSSITAGVGENKQFVPFVSSPPSSATSFPASQPERVPSFSESVPSLSQTKSEANVDLQDVLAAAQAAVETAEHAAAAARSAANLALVRITELVTKRNDRASERDQHEFHTEHANQTGVVKEPTFDQQHSFGRTSDLGPNWGSDLSTSSSLGMPKLVPESLVSMDHQSARQPQRSTSLEDDPYSSYPNLFTRQDSNLSSKD